MTVRALPVVKLKAEIEATLPTVILLARMANEPEEVEPMPVSISMKGPLGAATPIPCQPLAVMLKMLVPVESLIDKALPVKPPPDVPATGNCMVRPLPVVNPVADREARVPEVMALPLSTNEAEAPPLSKVLSSTNSLAPRALD